MHELIHFVCTFRTIQPPFDLRTLGESLVITYWHHTFELVLLVLSGDINCSITLIQLYVSVTRRLLFSSGNFPIFIGFKL